MISYNEVLATGFLKQPEVILDLDKLTHPITCREKLYDINEKYPNYSGVSSWCNGKSDGLRNRST